MPGDDEPIANLPRHPRLSREEALRQVQGQPRPVGQTPTGDDAFPKEGTPEAGGRFLASLLFRSFFYDYFVRLAHRKYVGSSASRVRRAAQDHPKLHRFVIVMDMVLLTLVTFSLVVIAVAGAWKTLSPVPLPW